MLDERYLDVVKGLVNQSCPTLCDRMDCSLPGSSVHRILQARILEWVANSFSRGSSWPRDWTQVSGIAGRPFTVWATREAHQIHMAHQSPHLRETFLQVPLCTSLHPRYGGKRKHTTSMSSPLHCTPLCVKLVRSQLYHLSGPLVPPMAPASRTAHE